jgi:hypothetical protein
MARSRFAGVTAGSLLKSGLFLAANRELVAHSRRQGYEDRPNPMIIESLFCTRRRVALTNAPHFVGVFVETARGPTQACAENAIEQPFRGGPSVPRES